MQEIEVGSGWKSRKDYFKPFVHHLDDSEQDVLVRRVDMSAILEMGLIEELDFFQKALLSENKSESADTATTASAITKPDNFKRMSVIIDAICLAGVLSPKIYKVPEHENARQDGLLYVDEIPWEDRMELFGVIFGSNNEESTFRPEQDAPVGTVANVETVSLPADESVAGGPDDTAGVLFEPSSA